MRKLIRQIKQELKTAKHCAIYLEELSRVWPGMGRAAKNRSRNLPRSMVYVSAFIATVYARFSIETY